MNEKIWTGLMFYENYINKYEYIYNKKNHKLGLYSDYSAKLFLKKKLFYNKGQSVDTTIVYLGMLK